LGQPLSFVELRQSKVDDLDHVALALPLEKENVVRLEVSVD